MKLLRRLALAVAVVAAVLVGVADGAIAQERDGDEAGETPGFGGAGKDSGSETGAAEYSVTDVHDTTAVKGPGSANGFVTATAADTSERIPPAATQPCLGWHIVMKRTSLFTADGVLLTFSVPSLECEAFLTCGTERVDDYRTGQFSGGGSGRMGQYIASAFAPVGLTPPAPGAGGVTVATDIGGIATAAAPTTQPSDEAMLVMRWCVRDDTDALIMPWESGTWGVSFTWDTTVEAEYPVEVIGLRLIDEITARIQTYVPVLDTVPPLAQQRTYVKWPTWMWVDEPLDEVQRYAVNDLETVRVEVRANLRNLTFTVGEGASVTCTAAEMIAYRPDDHDPLDPPGCHHVFEERGSFEFGVMMTYDVEVRVTYSPTGPPFADSAWVTHPTVPTITRSTEPVTMAVRELRAVNVREELAVEVASSGGD